VPSAPTLSAVAIGPTEVLLTTTEYSGDCTHTATDWWVDTDTPPDEGNNTVESEDDSDHKTRIVLGGLTAGTTYYAQARHVNACGDGTKSNVVEFATPAEGDQNDWPVFVFEVDGTHYAIQPDMKLE
jgi:hypothetical protein